MSTRRSCPYARAPASRAAGWFAADQSSPNFASTSSARRVTASSAPSPFADIVIESPIAAPSIISPMIDVPVTLPDPSALDGAGLASLLERSRAGTPHTYSHAQDAFQDLASDLTQGPA